VTERSSQLLVVIFAFVVGAFVGLHFGFGFGFRAGLRAARKRPSPLAGNVWLIGAAAMLLIAILSGTYTLYFLAASTKTEGVIVQVRESKGQQGDTLRHPVYCYRDSEGNEYTSTTNLSEGTPWEVGDKIAVRYLTGSPDTSRIDTLAHHWFLTLFGGGGGLIMGVIGGVLRWHYRAQVRKGEAKQVVDATAPRAGGVRVER